jgi:hypothetical protein
MWEIVEDKADDHADKTGNGSLDDIESLPGAHPSVTTQTAEDTCSDQISKRSAEQGT